MKNSRFILIIVVLIMGCGTDQDGHQGVVRLRVKGSALVTPDGVPIDLRGLNWGWWDTAQPQDAQEAKSMSANVIRMPIRWYFTGRNSDIRNTDAPGHIDPEGLAKLDQYIDWCAEQQRWVILFAGSDLGAGDSTENYWTNQGLRQEFKEMWMFLADRYKDKPYIAAYEILSEPHPKKPATGNDLRLFYEELISTIRTIDVNTPVMIGANDHYDINLLEEIYTKIDDQIIYTFNFYLPTEYIKPEKREQMGLPLVSYPSKYTDLDGNEIQLDKNYLVEMLQPAIAFRIAHDVPLLVNQVGVRSRCPGHLQYMEDVGDIFYRNRIPFTYWTYRTQDDATEYGLYWYDKKKDVYVRKDDQFSLMTSIFSR